MALSAHFSELIQLMHHLTAPHLLFLLSPVPAQMELIS